VVAWQPGKKTASPASRAAHDPRGCASPGPSGFVLKGAVIDLATATARRQEGKARKAT
jgi:hypothetical protein